MFLNTGDEVGTFEVKSGKLVVTDPCYDRGTWCMGTLENVKNGVWHAYTEHVDEGPWGKRVSKLVICHVDHPSDLGQRMERANFEVGVDSGQAGFFDDAVYPIGDRGEDGEFNKDDFYDECCHATVGEDSRSPKSKGTDAGIIRGAGVVSSSGFGDGSYDCLIFKNEAGEVVAAEIEFIGDYDEDEEEDELQCHGCGSTLGVLDGDNLCEKCGKFADAEDEVEENVEE